MHTCYCFSARDVQSLNKDLHVSPSSRRHKMDIDEVYTEIGEFGLFQKKIFWSFGFMQAVLALHQVHNVFIGATPTFYCRRGTGNDMLTIMGCPADGKPCDSYSFTGDDFTSIVSEVCISFTLIFLSCWQPYFIVSYCKCQLIKKVVIVY